MRKKWIRLIAAAMGSFLLAGCGADTQIDDYATNAGAESVQQTSGTESAAAAASATGGIPKDEIKVGVLHLSDPAEGSGYTYTHDLGIQGMQQNLGLSDDQIVRKINVSDSDVPDAWTATAVYSKTTYTNRQVATGYQASAVYRGTLSKTSIDHVTYTVTYIGSKLPILPFLDPDVTISQIMIVCGAAALLLLLLILWVIRYILWHTARVYVYNEERRIHDVVSRQFVRVRTPRIRLSALQGHAETEYTVILRRKLAKRLIGRDIAIETGGEAQHHVVEAFVGSDYAFGVRI